MVVMLHVVLKMLLAVTKNGLSLLLLAIVLTFFTNSLTITDEQMFQETRISNKLLKLY